MSKQEQRKGKLYRAFLKIGFIGFGGGNALVPIIEKEVIDEQKMITKAQYDRDIVVANITPGALPMEMAAGIGKQCGGVRSMLLAAFCISTPGALLSLLLLSVLNSVDAIVLNQIEFLSVGITAFIMCMLTGYISKTLREAKARSKRSIFFNTIIVLGVFVLTMGKNVYALFGISRTPIFALSTIQVLILAFFVLFYTKCAFRPLNTAVCLIVGGLYLACVGKSGWITSVAVERGVELVMLLLSIYGFAVSLRQEKKLAKPSAAGLGKELIAWLLVWGVCLLPALWYTFDSLHFSFKGILSSLMSFGGGDAYLVVADGIFVDGGILSESAFYGKVVPVVNVLPGSILCKTMTGIGYLFGMEKSGSYLGGLALALLGYASSMAASGGIFCLGYYVFGRYKKLDIFHLLRRLVKPIISGLLITVMLSLVRQNVSIGESASIGVAPVVCMLFGIYALDLWLYNKKNCSNGVLVAVSAVLSFVLCNVWTILG